MPYTLGFLILLTRLSCHLSPSPRCPGLLSPLTCLLFQPCYWSVLVAEPAQLGPVTGVGWTQDSGASHVEDPSPQSVKGSSELRKVLSP